MAPLWNNRESSLDNRELRTASATSLAPPGVERRASPSPDESDAGCEINSFTPCQIETPLKLACYTEDRQYTLLKKDINNNYARQELPCDRVTYERAGPRKMLYFDPANVKVAILNNGSICPGLNGVLDAMVRELYLNYGVRRIRGIQFGFKGLNPSNKLPFIELEPDVVRHSQSVGGTLLGSSRCTESLELTVDTLHREDIHILFVIGGEGTLAYAHDLAKEISRREINIGIIGIPKTIDNDICLITRTFGYDTVLSEAVRILHCAYSDARNHFNGIVIVKLLGHHSGFVAASATIASSIVDFVLVPEIDFQMEGDEGFLMNVERRLKERGHVLIVVSDGVPKELVREKNASVYPEKNKTSSFGRLLKVRLEDYFSQRGIETTVKYRDPSFLIRTATINPSDKIFCDLIGKHAVHAGLAGKTDILVGYFRDEFVHVPINAVIGHKKQIDQKGELWWRVLESTGQLSSIGD